MFDFIGRIVSRGWYVWLLLWIAALLICWRVAPSWEEVAQDLEFSLLPETSPSLQAEQKYNKAFPASPLGSNIVLVFARNGDASQAEIEKQNKADREFIKNMVWPKLTEIAEKEGGLASKPTKSEGSLFDPAPEEEKKPREQLPVADIITPDRPGAGTLLVSPDNRALLVDMELTTEFLAKRNWPIIKKVENLISELQQSDQLPPGLEIFLTGSAVVGRDHTLAMYQSARATTTLTVILVIVLLLLIYRSPVLALIPLAAVFIAVTLARFILAILASYSEITHVSVFEGLEVYITILAYGAGVDYSLFLTARYREELDRGAEPGEAVARSIGKVGAALTASAATVICGIAMMCFAQFGKFRQAGVAIPLSLVLVLLATLTFSPALLRLAGRWAFWPLRPRSPAENSADRLPGESAWTAFVRRFSGSGELQWLYDRLGLALLRRPGTIWLATVAVMMPFVIVAAMLYRHVSYDVVAELPAQSPSVSGTRVMEEHFPAGMIGPATVLLVNPDIDFRSKEGQVIVAKVTEQLSDQKEDLHLDEIRTLTAPLGSSPRGVYAFAHSEGTEPERQAAAKEIYTASMGERNRIGTRLDFTSTDNPFTRDNINALSRIENAIRAALPENVRGNSQLYTVGTTASVRDLATTLRADRTRIQCLVLASVFIILLILLRRPIVTAYLIVSVLFSYYVTLGVTFTVFWLFDRHGFQGLDWQVPIFLFTILIAVGEDYNIFLLTRVHEEEWHHGPLHGIVQALCRTGPIISSCGIIMAGTFASLMAGSLHGMRQLGFALAFGVLLDTFVVRPILVPAFLVLLRSGKLPLLGRVKQIREPEPLGRVA